MGRVGLRTIVIIGGMLASANGLEAQRSRGPGGFFGFGFVAADPMGEMGQLVEQGFGFELAGGVPMAAGGHLRLRMDVGGIIYGIERFEYCSFGCRLSSELTTTNSIVYGGIGPELVLARGNIQPYVHAMAGMSYFVTSSSLDDHDGYGSYLDTTNYDDVVFALRYGGGLRMRVGGGRRPVFLDFGVERHDNGVANYLTRGDIVDEADGSVTIYPNRSEADLMSFTLGVTFGFPGH